MQHAGRAAAETLAFIAGHLKPGLSTAQIDSLVREDTARRGGKPSQLGYQGFPHAVCTSRNQVVCHGMPSRTELLENGDILNVDVTTELAGFHGDTSATFVIGDASPEARHVVDVARRCLHAGISVVRPGARLGDIGAAIDELARKNGCSVVRDYGGHGIGRLMHQEPHVAHVGQRGSRTSPAARHGVHYRAHGEPRQCARALAFGWLDRGNGRWQPVSAIRTYGVRDRDRL